MGPVVSNTRELKQRRRQRQRKRNLKIQLYYICNTSRLFQLAQLLKKRRTIHRETANYPGTKLVGAAFKLKKKKKNENFTVVCSRSSKNLEFGHFTLLFCRGQRTNVPKRKNARAERLFLLIKPIVLWRCHCRCRRRRRCLSSLLSKTLGNLFSQEQEIER